MKMTFGKHKGVEIEDLDDSYLTWLCEEANIYDHALRDAIEQEYDSRNLGISDIDLGLYE